VFSFCCSQFDREEVIVFRTVSRTVKLAKAIYLGPNDEADEEGISVSHIKHVVL